MFQTGWVVQIEGTKILYMQVLIEILWREKINYEGCSLLPGLIEGHSHVLLHPYNETSWNDQVLKESETERVVRAVSHLKKTLKAGFTTIIDLISN